MVVVEALQNVIKQMTLRLIKKACSTPKKDTHIDIRRCL